MTVTTKVLYTAFFLILCNYTMGQEKNVYTEMSLDEILDVDVAITASKKPEDLFETPLSVTIIKKEDIINSGSTSIMEALRLSQGVIVREVTPGNYDVHIRGFDDMTKNAYINLPYNSTTLVMIDNRIVYNYFSGGTFWETLPIDIHDVERIEVVRGPASALYGANAATGVINIITSHADKQGLNAFANASIGNNNFKKLNTNIGYNWNDNTSLTISGNLSEQHRFDNMYYNWYNSEYSSYDDLSMMMSLEKDPATHETWEYLDFSDSLNTQYDIGVSQQRMGINLFFDHKLNTQSNLNIALGVQKSQAQKPGFLNFATPLSQNNSSSFYFSSNLNLNNLFGQFNLSSGEDLNSNPGNSFKYTNTDFTLEYLLNIGNISLRPGLSFKYLNYNSPITYDEPFDLSELNYQIKDQDREMTNLAGSVLADWKPTSKLRLIGGIRTDKFNVNKFYFTNYELAATYRINKNNLVRATFSRANRSPFILDTYLNAKMNFSYLYEPASNTDPIDIPVEQYILAKKDQKYPENTSIEINWRKKFNSKLDLDIEVFSQKISNLLPSNEYREVFSSIQMDSENQLDSINSGYAKAYMYFENLDIGANQIGMSFMLKYAPSDRINLQLQGTFQKTKLTGITEIQYNTTDTEFSFNNNDNTIDALTYSNINLTLWSEKLTPTFYGGFMLNYHVSNRLNVNTNGYLYTKQVFAGIPFFNIISDYTGVSWDNYMTIKAHTILNTKVSYDIGKQTQIYINLKNILGEHREFGFTDKIGTTCLIGLSWEL